MTGWIQSGEGLVCCSSAPNSLTCQASFNLHITKFLPMTSLPDAQAKLRSSIYYHSSSYGQYCQYSLLILVTMEIFPDIKQQPAGSLAIDKQTWRTDQTRERIKAWTEVWPGVSNVNEPLQHHCLKLSPRIYVLFI